MKKALFLVVCTLVFAVASVSAQTKIVVWSFTDELKDMIERFNGSQKEVKAELVIVPTDQYWTKLKATLRSGSGAPDVFTGEAAVIKDIMEAGYWAEIDKAKAKDLVPYVVKIATDAQGKLRALTWQTTPGGTFYRRSMAKKYFGSDDPAEVGKLFATWDKVLETARTLKEKSAGKLFLVSGYNELQNAALYSRTQGWVNAKGEFVFDESLKKYMELAKIFRTEKLEAKIAQWQPGWYNAMKQQSKVFSFFMPTWGLHYLLKKNAPDSSGDWGLTNGPAPWFNGGTWIGAWKGSKNVAAGLKFVEFMTVNKETLEWWAKKTGDFLAEKNVIDKIKGTFSEPYLAGQNHYEYFSSQAGSINGELLTKYDDTIGNKFFSSTTNLYVLGKKTMDEAIAELKRQVKSAYPDLKVK